MKKFLCGLLVLVFVFASGCFAEEALPDVSAYTIEQLIALRATVEAEIRNRVDSGTATLAPGKYVTGTDIVAGSYILVGLMDEAPNGYTPQVLYAETVEKVDDRDYIDYTYLETDETWRITLQDGMVLEVRYGECAIQQAPAILFAP